MLETFKLILNGINHFLIHLLIEVKNNKIEY